MVEMSGAAFIVCAFGICFNPAQITYMEAQGNITGNCRINFAETANNITIPATCEQLASEINNQLAEKSGK
jgi:hypothetical protein